MLVILGLIIVTIVSIQSVREIRWDVSSKNEYNQISKQAVTVSTLSANNETDIEDEGLFVVNHDQLKMANPDYIGWIRVPYTQIGYPICKGTDNSFYLDHTFSGSNNKNGCLFMDYRSSFGDNNAFIYGHNMRTGAMFGELHKLADKQIDRFYLMTPNGTFTCKIYSVHQAMDDAETYRIVQDDQKYLEYIQRELSLSDKNFGVPVSTQDKTIVLSTCQGVGDTDERYVVVAKY